MSFFMSAVKAYSHEHLLKLLKQPLLLHLIDVRDIDFGSGGAIKYSVNVPSLEFNSDKAAEIVAKCKGRNVSDIVCYCSFGRARSVQCAKLLEEARRNTFPSSDVGIGYLEGGFVKFRAWYYDTEYVIYPLKRQN